MANDEIQDLSKKGRNSKKRQRESSSQTDDDLVDCCDASLDLSEIKAKIDKLLMVFSSKLRRLKNALHN